MKERRYRRQAFLNVVEKTALVTRGTKKIYHKYHLIKIDGTEKLEILVGPFVDQLLEYFEASESMVMKDSAR